MHLDTATWRKSARSSDTGGMCVEVADLPGFVGIRDSKNPNGPKLLFTRSEWRAFVGGLKAGRFDSQS